MTTASDQVPSWINKGQHPQTWPEWLSAVAIGRAEANGSLMIRSRHGQARVHKGAMAFVYGGHVYTCPPADARTMLAELRAADALVPASPPPSGAKAPRAEADVADRRDDTDDISRRIRALSVAEQGDGAALSTQPERPPVKAQPAPAAKPAHRPAANPVQKPVKTSPARGSMPSIEWIQLDRLLVDDSYQRSVDTGPSRALISRIGREWDWRLCVPLMVSRRLDGLFVIDGQHRLFGARLRHDIPQLPCCISVYSGPADEAAMFVAANRERRVMNRLDDFHAAQAGGNAEALEVAHLVEAAGFFVSRRTGSASWAPGEVAFTSAIAKALRRFGRIVAADALQLMAEAFEGQRLVVGSSVFTAIVEITKDRQPEFRREILLKALRTFDMAGWASFISSARGGDTRNKQLKDMLLEAYADAAGAAS